MTDVMLTGEPTEVEIQNAFIQIGLNNDSNDPTKVLEAFKQAWESNKNDADYVDQAINAKNVIIRHLVSEQMKNQRYFEIVSPFENSCTSCKGVGEIFKFNKKPVDVNCHICGGKKKIRVKCRVCKGTGRYIKRFPEGGGLNLECKVCNGTGKVDVKCPTCIGKGKIKKIVLDHVIKSVTPCKHCEQLGFIVPKQKKKHLKRETPSLGTPVLDHSTGIKLSKMITEA